MKSYLTTDDAANAQELCVAEKYAKGKWIGKGAVVSREHTTVEECPCQPYRAGADIRLWVKSLKNQNQKLTVEFWLPCSETWWKRTITVKDLRYEIKYKVGTITEWPTKVRLTKIVRGEFEMELFYLLLKPANDRKLEDNFLVRKSEPSVTLNKNDVVEYDIIYKSRRLEEEPSNRLEKLEMLN